ncbi:MAG: hypothetical protein AAGA20_00930 [Planctomycetota bacterium]
MSLRAVLALTASLALLALASVITRTGPEQRMGDVVESERGPRGGSASIGERASLAVTPSDVSVETMASGTDDPDARIVEIVGRCLGTDRSQPLAACEVRFLPGEGRDAIAIVTDDEGRFRAAVPVRPDDRVSIELRASGRALTKGRLRPLPSDLERANLGDVLVAPGGSLVAHVVDEAGDPVTGVPVRFVRETMAPGGTFRFDTSFTATTDMNGRASSDFTVASGAWRFEMPGHLEIIEPDGALEVAAAGSRMHTIVVRRPDPSASIAGRVVDESGQPAAMAWVSAVDGDGRRLGSTASGEDGAFVLVRQADMTDDVYLRAETRDDPPLRCDPDLLHAWGSTDVELRVREVDALMLQVAGATDDSSCSVHWALVGEADVASTFGSTDASTSGGALAVYGLPTGRIRFAVEADDPALGSSDIHVVEFDGVRTSMDVELRSRVELEVVVTYADGTPAIGSEVELARPYGDVAIDLDTHAMDVRRLVRTAPEAGSVLLVDRAETDGEGRARLSAAPSDVPSLLRITGPDHVATLVEGVRIGPDSVNVIVSRGATVTGTVRPLRFLDRAVRAGTTTVVLTYAGEEALPGRLVRRTGAVDESGAFEVAGLHSGRWNVQLRSDGLDPAAAPFSETFDPIVLADDEERALDLDVSHLVPAVLTGRLLVDGHPLGDAELDLVRVVPWDGHGVAHAGFVRVETDVDGRFTADSLRPGRYHAVIERDGVQLISPDSIAVAPDEAASMTFAIDVGHLAIRIVDDAGEPLALATVVVENAEIGFRMTLRSDDDGVVEPQAIAANRYRIHGTRADGQSFDAGELLVPAGQAGLPIDISASSRRR